jgi:hypothetical protein
MSQEVLPDSRLKDRDKGAISILHPVVMNRLNWVPIFCANCGAPGGWVPEDTTTFAFYLCNPCAEKWSPLAGTMAVPDEIFWQKVRDAEMEQYGRVLSTPEVIGALNDPESVLSKLAKEAPKHL